MNDVVSTGCAAADVAGNEATAVCGATILPSFCSDTCCIYNKYIPPAADYKSSLITLFQILYGIVEFNVPLDTL